MKRILTPLGNFVLFVLAGLAFWAILFWAGGLL